MSIPKGSDAVVVISGAARGIGRAMTLGLISAGARVAALDVPVSDDAMAETMALAKAQGLDRSILPLHCDVTKPEACLAAVEAAVKHFGAVHGLINNAALGMQNIGFGSAGKKFYEVDVGAWRGAFDVNVNGPFLMAKAMVPRLLAQGWGRIVNLTTSLPTMLWPNFCPYGPTKAALEAITVIWSKDMAGSGVTVNALLPGGAVNTRMIPDDEIPDRSTLVQPDDMVAPIRWLMSRASDGVTGQRIIAKDWDAKLPVAEAMAKAGAAAGW